MNRRSAVRRIAKLEQTLAEKDQFLATVSHELRTPLTAVVGMLEVINDNLENLDPDQYAALLADARDGALELERLIEDYLTAARLSAGALTIKQEVVNLDTIFGRTIARLNLPETLAVTVDPLGSCVGDSLRIRQIARNILRNAARYADHQIQVRNVGDDSFVVIEIRNDGDPVARRSARRAVRAIWRVAGPRPNRADRSRSLGVTWTCPKDGRGSSLFSRWHVDGVQCRAPGQPEQRRPAPMSPRSRLEPADVRSWERAGQALRGLSCFGGT